MRKCYALGCSKPYLKAIVDLKLLLEKAGGDFITHGSSRSSWGDVLTKLWKCTCFLISTSISGNDGWLLTKSFWKCLGFWITRVFHHSRLAVCKTEVPLISRITQCQDGQSTCDSVRWCGKWIQMMGRNGKEIGKTVEWKNKRKTRMSKLASFQSAHQGFLTLH